MKDIIVWAIHAPAGTVVLVTAVLAMFVKKGSAHHKKAGSWFTVSMMVMLASGIAAAYLKNSIDDMNCFDMGYRFRRYRIFYQYGLARGTGAHCLCDVGWFGDSACIGGYS